MSEDIAVVGVALRFPGNATSPEELWKVLEKGESQWTEIPKDRLNIDGYYHPSGDRQGSISFRGGHFLKNDVGAFDAPFFSVAAEDAKAIDPQQRMLLEVSYEAIENAGLRKEDLDGSDTSVYVGSFVKGMLSKSTQDYEQICLRDPDWQPQYAATGNGIAIMANRISYFFNLHGPSMTLDTGCSGSLVSVHLAAQSLRSGESSLAIAAGAGMILTPNTIMPMTALNFLSPDGKCFTFDARANGYGRGEGIGVVVLKRLSDAIRDNDTIRSVIRGSGVNQDGRTTGITLPSKEAQVANIRAIYKSANLDFDQTAYVECHGTGTQAGDWRELKAISETLATVRPSDRPIVVGSVKPNIGHLEGAAGVAGLIKGVLILEHGKIPPNINFENGNPDIDFTNWKVEVPREVLDWPLSGIRRVSVNCFGFGGTNAHVIMDEAPTHVSLEPDQVQGGDHQAQPAAHEYYLDKNWNTVVEDKEQPVPRLFCYSSHEKGGVKRIMDSHLPYLEEQQIDSQGEFTQNYSYTLGCRRSNLEWKATLVGSSVTDLISKIQHADSITPVRSSKPNRPRFGLVFCGQGSQWAQMGKDLMSFDVFRRSLEEASYYLKTTFSSPFDLLEEIFKAPSDSHISDPEISQPAVTALQVALVDLLESFDIFSSHVVGHSSGEIAAGYAAGGLSRHAAWEVAYFRGLAAASIPLVAPKLNGGMAVVGMSLKDTEEYLAATGSSVQIACINSPRSITISGLAESIEKIAHDLQANKTFCRVLKVKTAYHSSHMRLVELDYMESLGNVGCRDFASAVRMFSSVTGHAIKGSELDSSYWAKNLVSPVQYVAAIESMMRLPADERPEIIIEMSPRVTLKTPTLDILQEIAPTLQIPYFAVLDGKTHGVESMLGITGELWCRGYSINMKNIVAQGKTDSLQSLSDLPPYAWNHDKSYWHESHLGWANRFREYPRQDLIGAPTADSVPFEPRWRGFLRISENPWIQDHQVQKTIVYPAAGMVSMVLEGARQTMKNSVGLWGYEIVDMRIEKAMVIPNTAHGLEVALNIKSNQSGTNGYGNQEVQEFSIYSKGLDRPWERHATGGLRIRTKTGDHYVASRLYQARHTELKASCTNVQTPRQLYELLDTVGMNYGSLFQNITDIRTGGDSCVANVRVPDTKSKMPAKFEYPHLIHPATLDSMFQTLFAIEPVPMVPTFIRSIFVAAELGTQEGSHFTGYATAHRTGLRDADATIVMRKSDSSQSYVAIDGLHLTGLSASSPEQGGFLPNHRNLCTEIIWDEDVAFAKPTEFHKQVAMLAHKHPDLSILQVGGGLPLARATLLTVAPSLPDTPRLARYTIADTDEVFSEICAFAKGTSLEPFLEKEAVNASEALPAYNLIIVMDNDRVNTDHLKKHLKPEGLLLSKAAGLVSNIVSGESLAVTPNVAPDAANFSGQLQYMNSGDDQVTLLNVYFNQQLGGLRSFSGSILVLARQWWYPDLDEFISHMEKLIKESCPDASFSRVTPEEVLSSPQLVTGKIVISALDFGVMSQNQFVYDWTETEFNTFHALQKFVKGMIWITRAANMKPLNPKGAPIVALARTLISEDPLKTIVTFDIGQKTQFGSEAIAQNVLAVFNRTFVLKSSSGPREMEYAEEDGKLYIPRLRPVTTLNNLIEQNDHNCDIVEKPFHKDSPTTGLQLTISRPGLSDGSLYFTECDTPELGPDEVEVTVDRAAITHLDLETVMGRTVESTVGMDAEGRVVRVGSNVTDLKPGDAVVALVPDGAIKDAVRVNSRFVKKYLAPIQASFAISAYYALVHVGRVKPGRKVLVHAAMSAHGLAAIHLAVSLGAEVFATIFGPEMRQQREVLKSRGVSDDHILEADSDTFVTVILSMTNGKGLDVVYNPSQWNTEATFKCVRKCGGIVRFANKSPSPEAIRAPAGSVTVVNFDLRQLLEEDTDFIADIFDLTSQLSTWSAFSGSISKDYEMHEIENAFQWMESKPCEGHVTLFAQVDGSTIVPVLSRSVTKPLHEALDSDGTYLLAGGLGGLGRSIAELLVSNGARHLAFLSRSGAASGQAKSFIEGLTQKGINARVYCVDICDLPALRQVIKVQLAIEMPPVNGIFQCAGVIKDAVFDNMTYADWGAASKPKTVGSWNLLRAAQAVRPFPFFVFLASSAGVIGNRGQANYAAANCFEDAAARWARLQGHRAVSIDLGPVLGAGMLAEDEEILNILRASGFYGIRHEDFLKVVHHAITMEIVPGTPMPPQVTLGVGTGGIIRQNEPADPYWSRTALYSYLNLIDMPPPDLSTVSSSSGSQDLRTMLACCTDSGAAAEIVCAGLAGMLAKAMNMLPEEIDMGKPPNAYGVDSLVAVGVRNWVFSTVGVQVSVFEVLSDSTVAELAAIIADKGGFGVEKA